MFGLDDRTKMGTEVLLNRFVMKELNLMIDPQRKFVLTTKLKLEEGEWNETTNVRCFKITI